MQRFGPESGRFGSGSSCYITEVSGVAKILSIGECTVASSLYMLWSLHDCIEAPFVTTNKATRCVIGAFRGFGSKHSRCFHAAFMLLSCYFHVAAMLFSFCFRVASFHAFMLPTQIWGGSRRLGSLGSDPRPLDPPCCFHSAFMLLSCLWHVDFTLVPCCSHSAFMMLTCCLHDA